MGDSLLSSLRPSVGENPVPPDSRFVFRDKTIPWVAFFLASFITLLLYRPGLSGQFVFDDFPNLIENESLKALAQGDELTEVLRSSPASELGRPLAMLSFGLQVWLEGGLHPWSMKAVNLGLHLLTGLSLLLVMLAVQRDCADSRERASLLAAVVVCLWLLAAIQVSTVLYVVQRMEILAALMVTLGLLLYQKLRRGFDGSWGRAFLFGAVLGLWSVFGALAKEHALLLPVFCALLELILLRGRGLSEIAAHRLKRLLVGLIVVPFLIGYAGLWAYGLFFDPFTARDFDGLERALAQGPILIGYLEQILIPRAGLFPFYYDHLRVPSSLFDPPTTALAWLALLALILVAWRSRLRRPWFAFGVFWFLLGHAITSAPLPLELAFEHRNYLASFGAFLAVADLVVAAFGVGHRSIGILAIWAIWQTAVALHLVMDWRDPLRHAEVARERAPLSARAHYEFGRLLYPAARDVAISETPRREMREAFEQAARLESGTGLAEVALILDAARHGEPTEPWWWDALIARLTGRGVAVGQHRAIAGLADCVLARRCPADDPGLARLVAIDLGEGPWLRDNALLLGWMAYRAVGDFSSAAAQFARADREGGLDDTSLLAYADALSRIGGQDLAEAILKSRGLGLEALEVFRSLLREDPNASGPEEENPQPMHKDSSSP
ncbi:MAG: hypothetical protein KatS3mg125_0957 [Lysobacterales bacterium]|nr:MAG: hypothetical protein KatS3mg125_0957 [Xanthomonadales bacterium]